MPQEDSAARAFSLMKARFDINRLAPVSLEISAIQSSCQTWRLPRIHRTGGLATFTGTCGTGSDGRDDALHIRWILERFARLARPDGLVIDCRDLHYTWGDDLSFDVWDAGMTRLPVLVVTAPEQAAAYAYALGVGQHRSCLHTALLDMDALLRALKSRL